MRKLLIVLGIVALCSAPVWADSVEFEANACQLHGPGINLPRPLHGENRRSTFCG